VDARLHTLVCGAQLLSCPKGCDPSRLSIFGDQVDGRGDGPIKIVTIICVEGCTLVIIYPTFGVALPSICFLIIWSTLLFLVHRHGFQNTIFQPLLAGIISCGSWPMVVVCPTTIFVLLTISNVRLPGGMLTSVL
jgi:hypothetical protein